MSYFLLEWILSVLRGNYAIWIFLLRGIGLLDIDFSEYIVCKLKPGSRKTESPPLTNLKFLLFLSFKLMIYEVLTTLYRNQI